ncbi:MAG TPA: phosphatase PAP2 family protein [Terracidiphilus sp.]|nr:phosphatase PAP2 family protein [Terracidiphilus sp.]
MRCLITLFVLVPSLTAMVLLLPICGFMCTRRNHDKRWDWMLAAGVLSLPIGVFVDFFIRSLSKLVPHKLDLYVYRFSEYFGTPSFHIGQFLSHHLVAYLIIYFAYSILPCSAMAVFSFYLWKFGTNEARPLLMSFVLNLVLALPIYFMFPVCGPTYAFAGFPNQLPGAIVPHPVLIDAPPNGIPSVHFSSALPVFWFARRWKWGTILAGTHLAPIAIATLGLGEHYILDLVIAVPYTALVIWLCHERVQKEDTESQSIRTEQTVFVPHADA